MKHLKSFNEKISHDELKQFCGDYLIYLTDEGFDVEIRKNYDGKYYSISIDKTIDEGLQIFEYNDIKDYFIPFLQLLNDNYKIIDNVTFIKAIGENNFERKRVKLATVLNNRTRIIDKLYSITVSIHN